MGGASQGEPRPALASASAPGKWGEPPVSVGGNCLRKHLKIPARAVQLCGYFVCDGLFKADNSSVYFFLLNRIYISVTAGYAYKMYFKKIVCESMHSEWDMCECAVCVYLGSLYVCSREHLHGM